jgi:hypothetical protein
MLFAYGEELVKCSLLVAMSWLNACGGEVREFVSFQFQ